MAERAFPMKQVTMVKYKNRFRHLLWPMTLKMRKPTEIFDVASAMMMGGWEIQLNLVT